MTLSVYIHIPFCRSKCNYCDFTSFAHKEDKYKDYKTELIKEINEFNNERNYTVTSIFIGGGTPSVLPASYIEEILEAVYKKFNMADNAEITIEANPESITAEKAFVYKNIGINRVSMGLQAWQNKMLLFLGRIHTRENFVSSFNILRDVGFNNINADIMFALPNQSMDMWVETLEAMTALSPEHISAYSLIIEEDTPFFFTQKEVPEDLDRNMYHYAVDFFRTKGYDRYEISNFSKKGCECKHNLRYWDRKNYVGFGAAAHSFIDNVRYGNTKNIDEYLNGKRAVFREILTKRESFSEFMFLGLRKTNGIKISDFEKNFGISIYDIYKDEIEKALKNNLLIKSDGFLYLSDYGTDVSNSVFCEFL